MSFRFYFLFIVVTLLFLFYPGDSPFFQILAHNKDLFIEKKEEKPLNMHPIPILRSTVPPELTAQGVYIVDLKTFTPVFERNAKTKLFPASTTKVVTALVTFDKYKPDDIITVKESTDEGTLMGLVPDEQITVENLLYGLLVSSGNDAAYTIAHNYGYDKFMNAMNEKAQQLGMYDSHFTNPAGLDEPTQQTSAFDLAIAGRALLTNPYLKKIVGTKGITVSDVDYKYFHPLTNVNRLLGEIPGLGGLKTGQTPNAGENLISFYKAGNHEFIIVILKSEDRFEDTKSAVNWIEANVDYISP